MRRWFVLPAAVGLATLTVAAQPAAPIVIHGRVVSAETSDALPHARIVIYNDATPLPAIFSDAQGRFAAVPLPADGRYRLTATKPGYAQTVAARLNNLPADGVEIRMARSAAISGRVIDRFGDPAAGVQVRLFLRAPDRTKLGPIVKTVSTDDLGEYRFGGLAEGIYVAGATTRTALVTPQSPPADSVVYYPGVTTIADAEDVAVHPGDEKAGVEFSGVSTQPDDYTVGAQLVQPTIRLVGPNGQSLTPTVIAGTGVIRGRVTRADGLPLAHATVSTPVPQRIPGANIIRNARGVQTDEDGRYEIAGLPAGQYVVSAARLGYSTTSYGQRADDERGTPVDIEESQVRTRIDIVLARYSSVTGRVVDEFGDPMENVSVAMSQIKYQNGRRRLVSVSGMSGRTTDDLGRYRIYAVPRGEYVVNASVGQVVAFQPGTGLSDYATTYFTGTANPREAQLVAVPRSQDVTGIDFMMVPARTATISGHKLGFDGQPFGGSLTLTPSQRSGAIVTPSTGARIYDDGRFEFPNVAPGEYVIQADGGKQVASTFVTVNGADVPDVLLQATLGSTISGRVVFEGDGASVQSLAITAPLADYDRSPHAGAQGNVGADLRFIMTGLHGPRRLMLGRTPPGWMLKSVFAKGVDVTDVALPFGTDDQSLDDVQIVITNRVTELSGTVVNARGDVALDYTLLVFSVDRDRWYPGSRYFRRSAASGNFTLRGLPPSDYFVAAVSGWSVLKDGDDSWQDPEFLESIALRAARATLTEGEKLALTAKLITP